MQNDVAEQLCPAFPSSPMEKTIHYFAGGLRACVIPVLVIWLLVHEIPSQYLQMHHPDQQIAVRPPRLPSRAVARREAHHRLDERLRKKSSRSNNLDVLGRGIPSR